MRKVVILVGMSLLLCGMYHVYTTLGITSYQVDYEIPVLDLSHESPDLRPVSLAGHWAFYSQHTIDPTAIPHPSTIVKVPNNWSNYPFHKEYGFASYHLTVQLPSAGDYAIFIDTIYTSYDVYANGHLIGSSGTFGTSEDEARPYFYDILAPFTTATDTVELVFHVSNFIHPIGGIAIAPIIGSTSQIMRFRQQMLSLTVILSTLFFGSALLVLFFYGKANKDHSLLWFSALCLSLAIKTTVSNSLLTVFFPSLPFMFASRLEYIPIVTAVISFLYYSHTSGLKFFPPFLFTSSIALSLGYLVIILFFPLSLYNRILLPFTVLYVFLFLYWIVSLALHIKKRDDLRLLLFGSIVFGFSIITENVYYLGQIPHIFLNDIAAIGMGFFILVNFYLLSERFLRAKETSDRSAEELEHRIFLRTRELEEVNRRLELLATKDELTGLYNRNELNRQVLEENNTYNALSEQERINRSYAVLYIDIDNFKRINDEYSHEAGDALLLLFSSLMRKQEHEQRTLFRAGGDEFVVFLRDHTVVEVEAYAHTLLQHMRETHNLIVQLGDGKENKHHSYDIQSITCSIGIAIHTSGLIDIDLLIKRADHALLTAKRLGKNRYHIHF